MDNQQAETKELTVEILYHSDEDTFVFIGGDNSNPSWEEYVDGFQDEFKPHIKLIKDALEKCGYVGETGEAQQRLGITFKFSDGEHWAFSWRGWGDMMQAVVNKKEGYMAYYM